MEASTANGIRIVAIPGSVRPGNFTGKALEHLRSVCSHVGAIVLPGSVSVARVQDLFDEQGRCGDEATERRIRSVATTLLNYIRKNICPGVALEEMARRGSLSWARVAGA